MKKKSLFKKNGERIHIVSNMCTTAGTDIDGRYSVTIQDVDGEECICVHKCHVRG